MLCVFEYPVRNIRNYPQRKEITHINVGAPLPFTLADHSSCGNDLLQIIFTLTVNMLLNLCPTILFFSCLASTASIRYPRAVVEGSTSPQPDYACTKDGDWFGESYNQEDCMAAVQRLWNVAVSQYETTQFEFLAPGATNTTTLPTVKTPQRYSSGQ